MLKKLWVWLKGLFVKKEEIKVTAAKKKNLPTSKPHAFSKKVWAKRKSRKKIAVKSRKIN